MELCSINRNDYESEPNITELVIFPDEFLPPLSYLLSGINLVTDLSILDFASPVPPIDNECILSRLLLKLLLSALELTALNNNPVLLN